MAGDTEEIRGGRGWTMARKQGIALALSIALLVSLTAWDGAHAGSAAAGVDGGAYLSLSLRPSHAGLYRAEVVERTGRLEAGSTQSWVIRVTRADGTLVEDAAVEISAWMPDTGERSTGRPALSAKLGGGRYRFDGLRIDRPGWWNIPLRIDAPAGVDSLAFNLVLRERAPS